MGAELARAGLRPDQLVFDLDETLWDWRVSVLKQPTPLLDHRETVFLRMPLLWLLRGLVHRCDGTPITSWTAGYGYRIDRVCEQVPLAAEVMGVSPDQAAEEAPHIQTRLDWWRAVKRQPDLCPYPDRWVSAKVPGAPTASGKPLVDAARILCDDKETNCRRFVNAGDKRSAIWMRNTERVWGDCIQLRSIRDPPARSWAEGVASALRSITSGAVGLYVAEPRPSTHVPVGVVVRLPHRRAWKDWLLPGREMHRQLDAK